MTHPEDDEHDVEPENVDIDDAKRLGRKYLYGGGEVYAPAVHAIASMLAEHRQDVLRRAKP